MAGLHLAAWARSDHTDVEAWRRRAARLGVSLATVQDFGREPTRPGLVFGFGAIPEERIAAGLDLLGASLTAMMQTGEERPQEAYAAGSSR